jgi:hypothetical protein
MANRLEREFPRTHWRVIAPVGPRGDERDIIRRYVARGRGWRSRAVRNLARGAAAAIVRCHHRLRVGPARGAWLRADQGSRGCGRA